jgi:hypothetical protein
MKDDRKERTAGAYIGAVIANVIVFIVVNKLDDWNVRFITDAFPGVLWALNFSLISQIAANAVLVFFHPRFLHYAAKVALGVISLLALIILVTVFPFDFSYISNWIGTMVRIALYIGLAGTAIAIVVDSFRLVGSFLRREQ